MIKEAIKEIKKRNNLSKEIMTAVMNEITQGACCDEDIAEFLSELREKGETVEEITAAAKVLKERCIKTELGTYNTLDIVGTGGDMSNTFNISTAAAFVAASGGIPVAKHGNRALTSKSGSSDVLEALGININKTPSQEVEIFKKQNLCFLSAQNHHPAMKYAAKARKMVKKRTLFNILGPLTNPAFAKSQLFGVFDGNLTSVLAEVISELGVENVLVVHGEDGLDEATICDKTIIAEARNGKISQYTIKPEDYGFKRSNLAEIQGGNAEENAQIIIDIFNGKETGAKRDIVILNSALAFYTFKKTTSIMQGISYAQNLIKSGMALAKLNQCIKITNEE
ncbi:MAG: anthranilate phosphoribosyltransferase [Candidatus Gastranaerophilales bacterium]|nr:anthranilate phosphoribosyltransferase [Candidatus Gastranaerophilales bacterium]